MKKSGIWSLLGLSALVIGLSATLAQETQAAPPVPANFTVAAGQSATVRVNVFCLDFSKDFPTGQNIVPGAPADEKLRSALAYAIDKGYDQSNPRQLQLALWNLRDNVFHTNAGENKTIAQEVIDSVAKAPTVAAGTGTALADAVKNGQATVTATGVQPLVQGEFYGTAVLEIKNTGTSSLTLSLAPGTVFTANGTNFQTLIGYPTGAQSSPASQATTSAVTTAPATTAIATTAVATTAPATTAVATTAAVTTAPATTAVATTAVATTAVATTAVATTAVATTAAPATTVATTVAAATVAAATATPTIAALPGTGAGGSNSSDSSVAILPLVLVMLALMAGTGLLVLKRRDS